jgi:hypothetical protein
MAMRKWFGALVAAGLVGAIVAGCSSSNATAPSDGGATDGGIHRIFDSGITIGDDATGIAGSFDGTTGKACTSDADCLSDAGPGVNTCSSDYGFTFTNVPVALWSTPVCIIPPPTSSSTTGNCDPAPDGNDGLPHFCDGPDDPSSPGLCLPFDSTNPQPNQGICYPLCTFALDGAKPTGCAGTDACVPYTFLRSTSAGTVTAFGFCVGGCQKDADCAALGTGYACQTDIGYCTTAKLTRPKALGAACTTGSAAAVDDDASGACNCDGDPTSGNGFCTSACIVGGAPCPDNWICDAGFQSPIVFTSSTGAPISVPVTSQNVGIEGTCRPGCALADGGIEAGAAPALDAGEDAGDAASAASPIEGGSGACPPNSTCQGADLVGPDCVP